MGIGCILVECAGIEGWCGERGCPGALGLLGEGVLLWMYLGWRELVWSLLLRWWWRV